MQRFQGFERCPGVRERAWGSQCAAICIPVIDMARPLKLEIVKELSGAYRKNPQRRRVNQTDPLVVGGMGEPPPEWVEGAANNQRYVQLLQIWKQIVAQDILRVLNPSHRMLVESTCYLMMKIRRANAGYGKATSGDSAQLKASLAAMGQTPIDSSRVAEAVRVPDRAGASSQAGRPGASWGEYVG